MGSTLDNPSQHRSTARTILFTSTASSVPLRLRTCMVALRAGTGKDGTVSENVAWRSVAIVLPFCSEGKYGLDLANEPIPPTSPPEARDLGARGRAIRQVFGLAGSTLLAHPSQSGEDQCDELSFRSCLPLRDSPGFTPGSLFSA